MTETRIFKVFVSSTFVDFVVERQALQERVWPRLRDFCRAYNTDFQAVDLRWGINQEASLDQRALPICLEELGRCQRLSPRPNLIILLGERYGWRPLPFQIPQTDFERILSEVPPTDAARLGWWYRLDENAVPAAYVLQPRTSDHRDPAVWAGVEVALRSSLQAGAMSEGIDPEPFLRSATHHEIVTGTAVGSLEDRWFAYFRTLTGVGADALTRDGYIDLTASGERDLDAAARIVALKDQLRSISPNAVADYQTRWVDQGPCIDDVARFCDMVEQRLRASIESELARLAQVDRSELETATHRNFADDRRSVFIGRKEALRQIAEYVGPSVASSRPLILYGEGGSGKSAIMAEGAARARDMLPDAIIVERYIGATPASTNAAELARGIVNEIARSLDRPLLPAHASEDDVLTAFAGRLTQATGAPPLVLFIDALDQLALEWLSNAINWLPVRLAVGCRLVLSARGEQELVDYELRLHPSRRRLGIPVAEVGSENDHHTRLQLEQLGNSHLVPIAGLELPDGELVLTRYLQRANRTLTDGQRRTVLDGFARNGLPLWLKLASDAAICWPSWQLPPELPSDVFGVIRTSLEYLSDESGHGHELVATALGLLASSAAGLTEGELLDLLSLDHKVMAAYRRRSPDSPDVARLPTVVWSRLYSDLQPYFQERRVDHAVVYNFFHREFTEVVSRLYLNEAAGIKCQQALADYFDNPEMQPAYLDQTAWKPNLRRLTQLPASVMSDRDRTYALLDDLSFPIAMTAAERFQELHRYYTLGATVTSKHDGLHDWRQFLRQYGHVLLRGDEAWPAHRVMLQRAAEHGNVSPVRLAVRPWLQAGHCDWHWLCSPVRSTAIGRTYCELVYEVPRAAPGDQVGQALHARVVDGSKTLVWSGDRYLYLWDSLWSPRGDRPLRLAGHRERHWDIFINEAGGIDVPPGTTLDDKKLGILGFQFVAGGPEPDRAGVYGALELGEGRILTWFHDRVMIVSDLLSGEALACLEGHADWVRGALDLDGQRFVSWGDDGCLRIWDCDTLECQSVIHAHSDWIIDGQLRREAGLFLTRDGAQTVRAWSLTDWSLQGVLESVPPSWDVVAVTDKGDVTLNDTKAHAPPLHWTLQTYGQPAQQMIMLDHRCCALLHRDGRFEVWDTLAQHWLNDCVGHTAAVLGLSHAEGGTRFLSWSADGAVRRWQMEAVDEDWPYLQTDDDGRVSPRSDEETGVVAAARQQERLERHRRSARHHGPIRGVTRVAANEFASWADDGDLRVWQIADGKCRLCIPVHSGSVSGAFPITDGGIVTWCRDGTVSAWALADGRSLGRLSLDDARFDNVLLIGGSLIVVVVTRESIRLWDLATLKEVAIFCEEIGPVRVDGARLLAGEFVLCWRVDDGGQPYMLDVWCIKDGRRHASFDGAVADGTDHMFLWKHAGHLVYWNLSNGTEVGRVKNFDCANIANALALARGKLLIRRDSGLTLWDVHGGEPRDVEVPENIAIQEIYHVDEQWLVALSDDKRLILLNATTLSIIGQVPAHSYAVRQLLPLVDREFLSVELDGTLRHLDFGSGQVDQIPLQAGKAIEQAIFLDRNRVLLRDLEGAVWLWRRDASADRAQLESITDKRLRPYRALFGGPVAGTDNLFSLSFGHSVGVYRIDDGEVKGGAEWVSDQAGMTNKSSVAIHEVCADGTLVTEVATGALLPLKLYNGNFRINLAELGEILTDTGLREVYA
jgi:WD40 repeat protein